MMSSFSLKLQFKDLCCSLFPSYQENFGFVTDKNFSILFVSIYFNKLNVGMTIVLHLFLVG